MAARRSSGEALSHRTARRRHQPVDVPVDGDQRGPGGAVDVHDLELAAADQLVSLRAADAQHRGRLVHPQQQPLALPRIAYAIHDASACIGYPTFAMTFFDAARVHALFNTAQTCHVRNADMAVKKPVAQPTGRQPLRVSPLSRWATAASAAKSTEHR